MLRYLIRRLALSLVTLLIVCTIVFTIVNVLPGNLAQRLVGGRAEPELIAAKEEELGLNDPLLDRFGRTIKSAVTLDFGDSVLQKRPVSDILTDALFRSGKLALYALVLTIPASIFAGIFAARRRDTFADRTIVTLGLASSSIPDFVSGVILQTIVFQVLNQGLGITFLPVITTIPKDASSLTQLRYLTLPAVALAVVYFGYIARMARAGMIKALDADFTRTATMKGLSPGRVIRGHVMRNGLQPTVSVVGTQVGYLFGSLVALEIVFNYPGLGSTIANASSKGDLPLLVGGVILVALIYMAATLTADLVLAWMNPRSRAELT